MLMLHDSANAPHCVLHATSWPSPRSTSLSCGLSSFRQTLTPELFPTLRQFAHAWLARTKRGRQLAVSTAPAGLRRRRLAKLLFLWRHEIRRDYAEYEEITAALLQTAAAFVRA